MRSWSPRMARARGGAAEAEFRLVQHPQRRPALAARRCQRLRGWPNLVAWRRRQQQHAQQCNSKNLRFLCAALARWGSKLWSSMAQLTLRASLMLYGGVGCKAGKCALAMRAGGREHGSTQKALGARASRAGCGRACRRLGGEHSRARCCGPWRGQAYLRAHAQEPWR